MHRLKVSVTRLLMPILTAPATAAGRSTRPGAVRAAPGSRGEMPTVRDAIEALSLIEAKIESGLLVGDRVPEFDELDVAISTLDEVLKTRGSPNLRKQLRTTWARYEQVEELWTVCLTESQVYKGELIPLKRANIASFLAREVLTEFPELDQSFADGGARSADGRWASCRRLLSALWADAKAQGKRLKTDVDKLPQRARSPATDQRADRAFASA
jgi:hypothetical protein